MPMMPGMPMGGPSPEEAMMMAQGGAPAPMGPPPFPSTDPQAIVAQIAQMAGADSEMFSQMLAQKQAEFSQAQNVAVSQAMQIVAQMLQAPPQAETMQGPAEAMSPQMG